MTVDVLIVLYCAVSLNCSSACDGLYLVNLIYYIMEIQLIALTNVAGILATGPGHILIKLHTPINNRSTICGQWAELHVDGLHLQLNNVKK